MPNKTLLVFGDIIGRLGRETLARELPGLLAEHKPDLVVANAENLAHGFGVTKKIIEKLRDAGIDIFTSGNHIWSNPGFQDCLDEPELAKRIIRPLNDLCSEGLGYTVIEKNTDRFLIINLSGTVFMNQEYPSPFYAVDKVLKDLKDEKFDAILVDFHAEATSEKAVLGLYLDGRVTGFYGTHTHVPTADERILPQGTAFITDIGMVGVHNEAIGGRYDMIVEEMKDGRLGKYEVPEKGSVEINGLVVKAQDGLAKEVKRIRKIV